MTEQPKQLAKRLFKDRAFVICTFVLILSLGFIQGGARLFGVHLIKKDLPLQASLDDLDAGKLSPYVVLEKFTIESEEMLNTLGTRDYIQWRLENPLVNPNDPTRRVMLFITYYTGDPGKVPHVPELCYTGSGSQVEDSQKGMIAVKNNEGDDVEIPVRLLTVASPQRMGGSYYSTVVYFFGTNGGFENSRNGVRIRTNNPFNKYAYFSKVEMTFQGGQKISYATALTAAEDLAGKVLPVLLEDHWPNWPPKD